MRQSRVNIVRGLRKVVSRERQMRKVGVYKLSLMLLENHDIIMGGNLIVDILWSKKES